VDHAGWTDDHGCVQGSRGRGARPVRAGCAAGPRGSLRLQVGHIVLERVGHRVRWEPAQRHIADGVVQQAFADEADGDGLAGQAQPERARRVASRRRTTSSTGLPAGPRIRSLVSPAVSRATEVPSTASTASPGSSPARSAGPPGYTSAIVPCAPFEADADAGVAAWSRATWPGRAGRPGVQELGVLLVTVGDHAAHGRVRRDELVRQARLSRQVRQQGGAERGDVGRAVAGQDGRDAGDRSVALSDCFLTAEAGEAAGG
jgi:hypothetical protein